MNLVRFESDINMRANFHQDKRRAYSIPCFCVHHINVSGGSYEQTPREKCLHRYSVGGLFELSE